MLVWSPCQLGRAGCWTNRVPTNRPTYLFSNLMAAGTLPLLQSSSPTSLMIGQRRPPPPSPSSPRRSALSNRFGLTEAEALCQTLCPGLKWRRLRRRGERRTGKWWSPCSFSPSSSLLSSGSISSPLPLLNQTNSQLLIFQISPVANSWLFESNYWKRSLFRLSGERASH